jgi:NAD(P)-dependent dehydrogenase (short-subunit alcohol dehydrogenase family)
LSDAAQPVWLVAGATGRIGGALARHVLARGGRVAAAVRRPWQVDVVRAALGREHTLVGLVATGDGEAAAGFVKGAQDALGPIAAFVGAAGRWQPREAGREPGGDLDELLAANLLANATLARAVLPFLRRRRAGALTFVGAADAAQALGSAAFAASKAALHEFVRALARDLDGTGVVARAVLLDAAQVADVDRVVGQLADPQAIPAAEGPLFRLAP